MFAECILVLKSYNLTTWQSNLKVDPDNKAIPRTDFDEQVVKKMLKFIYSEKATTFWEISTVDLTGTT